MFTVCVSLNYIKDQKQIIMRISNDKIPQTFETVDVTNGNMTKSCAVFTFEWGHTSYHQSDKIDFFDKRQEKELAGIWKLKSVK